MRNADGYRARLNGWMLALVACLLSFGSPALAQVEPFEGGWGLVADSSNLTFQSVKNGSIIETNRFNSLAGKIAEDGTAEVEVRLESIDTGIDLRNVRMRFLFFETFKFPEMTIRAALDSELLADLPERRRMRLPVDYEVDLHGVTTTFTIETVVTLLDDDLVSVASAAPITVDAELFGLGEGVLKLEDTAKVEILPAAQVSFDLTFARGTMAAAEAEMEVDPAITAMDADEDLDREACVGRFEILSRSGNIFFDPGSAELHEDSAPLLADVVEIIDRCPDLRIEVSGHTDSDGSARDNQRLSEDRAEAVMDYLVDEGVPDDRVEARGFGEERPAADNDTRRGKALNRRIEFAVADEE